MTGPGIYDKLCEGVRNMCEAEGVVLIVLKGHKGSGFSCQVPAKAMKRLPQVLRDVAQQMEEDLAKEKKANEN